MFEKQKLEGWLKLSLVSFTSLFYPSKCAKLALRPFKMLQNSTIFWPVDGIYLLFWCRLLDWLRQPPFPLKKKMPLIYLEGSKWVYLLISRVISFDSFASVILLQIIGDHWQTFWLALAIPLSLRAIIVSIWRNRVLSIESWATPLFWPVMLFFSWIFSLKDFDLVHIICYDVCLEANFN